MHVRCCQVENYGSVRNVEEHGAQIVEEQKLKLMQETNQGQGSVGECVCVYNHGLTSYKCISTVSDWHII